MPMSKKANKLSQDDFILYLLNKIEPDQSTLLRLNKLAFFTEFGFIYKQQKELSDAQYAAIDYGPVIDGYKNAITRLKKERKIILDKDGKHIRVLAAPVLKISEDDKAVIDELIAKYSTLNNNELIGLSHATDSYKITTNNEKSMGKIIDKDLAYLESFFDESAEEEIAPKKLPDIDQSDLVEYGVRWWIISSISS